MENLSILLLSGVLHCKVVSGEIAIINMLRYVSDESGQHSVTETLYKWLCF